MANDDAQRMIDEILRCSYEEGSQNVPAVITAPRGSSVIIDPSETDEWARIFPELRKLPDKIYPIQGVPQSLAKISRLDMAFTHSIDEVIRLAIFQSATTPNGGQLYISESHVPDALIGAVKTVVIDEILANRESDEHKLITALTYGDFITGNWYGALKLGFAGFAFRNAVTKGKAVAGPSPYDFMSTIEGRISLGQIAHEGYRLSKIRAKNETQLQAARQVLSNPYMQMAVVHTLVVDYGTNMVASAIEDGNPFNEVTDFAAKLKGRFTGEDPLSRRARQVAEQYGPQVGQTLQSSIGDLSDPNGQLRSRVREGILSNAEALQSSLYNIPVVGAAARFIAGPDLNETLKFVENTMAKEASMAGGVGALTLRCFSSALSMGPFLASYGARAVVYTKAQNVFDERRYSGA